MVEKVSLGTGICCVCKRAQEIGRVGQFEVCFTCYETGALLEWMNVHGWEFEKQKEDSI